MNQSAYLHRLQRIDTQIDQTENRLAEIERLLSEDERIRQAHLSWDESKRVLEKSRLALRSDEHNVQATRVKIEQSEASLYGGLIRNPKELQDLQREIESLKRHMAALEDLQLQAMLEQEEAEEAERNAQTGLHRAEAEVAEQKSGLAGERDGLLKNKSRLQAERSAALPAVLAANLEIYNRIREQKKGIAVSFVDDDTCTICGAEVRLGEGQAARMQSSLHYCTSCGRILFAG
jgi:uncharacterized protein